ncbi:MAG: M43 family zinc metalloprotease, partial [Bacteroidota bacterium]|nr:M43 family zinc metalloprotease [Bacteroidota bacterium]
MSRYLFLIVLIGSTGALSGQISPEHDRCKAHMITQRALEQQGLPIDILSALPHLQEDDLRGGTLTVPVVVHVVYNTPAENVPTSAIVAMINEINEDFSQSNPDISGVRPAFTSSTANVGIQFCLAQIDPSGNATTGITRTTTTDTWFDPDNQTDAMKSPPLGKSPWNTTEYLNIWICDISSGVTGSSVTLGYAYLPVGGVVGSNIDGLVIDYQYGLPEGSRTATHEIGHYFGLQHPWADGGCSSDDGFTDTPNTDTPTFSCANTTLQKCGNLTQYENFMDYSNCPVMYTAQQRNYMRGILNGVRSTLLNSGGCGGIGPTGPCIPTSANGTGEDDYINGVTLGTIANVNSGGNTLPTYTDFSATWSTSLTQGSMHTLMIQGGNYQPDHYAAWID